MRRPQAAFTLTELLLNLAIISLLVVVGVQSWREARVRAYDVQALACAMNIRQSETLHYNDSRRFAEYPSLDRSELHDCTLFLDTAPPGSADGRTYVYVVHHPNGRKYFIASETGVIDSVNAPAALLATLRPSTATPSEIAATKSYSGPLVITRGGTYSGNWESMDPEVAAVTVQTDEPVIIEDSTIRGRGDLISGYGNRITVRNVTGIGLNPNVAGRQVGKFIGAEEFLSVQIENNYAENTMGVYLRDYRGDPAAGDTAKILHNQFRNINGLPSDGRDGYALNQSGARAHAIQFNDVRRIPNVEIASNEMINDPGKSLVEENINMYNSSGTPTSHIAIHDNYIQGAYSPRPELDTGYAGGGIVIGDGWAADPLDLGYTDVYSNVIISTSNVGLALAGGVNNRIYSNRVIASGRLPDGQRIPSQNVGMYLWDAGNGGAQGNFRDNSVENNYVAWTQVNADGTTNNNPWWFPSCGTDNNTCGGNVSGGTATLEMEQQAYRQWQANFSGGR